MSYMDRVLTVSIPAILDEQVRAVASAGGVGLSEFTRQALAAAVKSAGYQPPPVQRRPSDRRADEIMALPEAVGRKELAYHLATETSLGVEAVRSLLQKAGRDPAQDEAFDILQAHRAVNLGQAPERPEHPEVAEVLDAYRKSGLRPRS